MFFHAPNNIYGPELLRMFIDELGGIKRVHKYLGVSERTVWNWIVGADSKLSHRAD